MAVLNMRLKNRVFILLMSVRNNLHYDYIWRCHESKWCDIHYRRVKFVQWIPQHSAKCLWIPGITLVTSETFNNFLYIYLICYIHCVQTTVGHIQNNELKNAKWWSLCLCFNVSKCTTLCCYLLHIDRATNLRHLNIWYIIYIITCVCASSRRQKYSFCKIIVNAFIYHCSL